MSKTAPLGNAADRLKLSRPMPVFPATPPLPKEGQPAVAVTKANTPAKNARSYRLSTYLTEDAGKRLNRLVQHCMGQGRRRGAPEVLERALLALERELGL